MSHLVEHMAQLAGQRDPAALDSCFIDLFAELLGPRRLRVLRSHAAEQRKWYVTRHHGVFDDISPDLPPSAQDEPLLQHCISLGQPLALPGEPVRTLVPLTTDSDEIAVVEIVTEQPIGTDLLRTVNAIQRFSMHLHALLDENERDSLTRLLNRKSFDETFVRAALNLDPAGAPTSDAQERRRPNIEGSHWLGVIDIDHFKRVNDVHGHLIGDEVLILVAQLMKNTFRASDRLYRFGGEEFVVLLRCSDALGAEAAFERFRRHVEQTDFPRVEHLTVSIGFTAIDAGDTPGSAFERADQAVYHAKENGRNMAVSHEALTACGLLQAKDQDGGVEFF
ncbi:GGDEF domain-containing protein [Sphaerotilus uruguayifluvii]|uniref:diguanylate cyclase n=1 Tax=Sphaerotilus uruguayifluvii TaxID=2735897 RepID=A0ABX2G340_9BURK|nr:GGDEF domain-containing protein [Leptothrix sp. C29]NRT56713.1 diguanylate cyclase (GGDEF)-like protein [Leptothrix sp. C29]